MLEVAQRTLVGGERGWARGRWAGHLCTSVEGDAELAREKRECLSGGRGVSGYVMCVWVVCRREEACATKHMAIYLPVTPRELHSAGHD